MGKLKILEKIDSFGERLRLIRLFFQLTQTDLAYFTGLQQGTLTKIERNIYMPDDEVANQLEDYFSLNPLYLRYGQTPIFMKKLIIIDFLIVTRKRKLHILLSDDALVMIVNYILEKERIKESFVISGSSPVAFLILESGLNYPHYFLIRIDIRTASLLKNILTGQNIGSHTVENTYIIDCLNQAYADSYPHPNYLHGIPQKTLSRKKTPNELHFLLDIPTSEVLSTLVVTERDIVNQLLAFFEKVKADDKAIAEAMKRFREKGKLTAVR